MQLSIKKKFKNFEFEERVINVMSSINETKAK